MFMQQMAQLEERRLEIQKQLTGADEYTHFGQTVLDMLRRMPDDLRPQVMWKI